MMANQDRVKKEQLDKIADFLKVLFGHSLEDVILYGSHAYGNPGPDSDINICAVVTDHVRLEEPLNKIVCNLSEAVGREVSLNIRTRQEFDSGRIVNAAIESSMGRGVLIYESGLHTSSRPTHPDEVRMAIAESRINNAYRKLYSAIETAELFGFNSVTAGDAVAGACMAIGGILANYDIDTSPKGLRWNPRNLISELVKIQPGYINLRNDAAFLKERWHKDPQMPIPPAKAMFALVSAVNIYDRVRLEMPDGHRPPEIGVGSIVTDVAAPLNGSEKIQSPRHVTGVDLGSRHRHPVLRGSAWKIHPDRQRDQDA